MPTKIQITPAAMCRLRRKGYSLTAIGKMAGVTRERVRQILAENNITGRWEPSWRKAT